MHPWLHYIYIYIYVSGITDVSLPFFSSPSSFAVSIPPLPLFLSTFPFFLLVFLTLGMESGTLDLKKRKRKEVSTLKNRRIEVRETSCLRSFPLIDH